MSHTEFYAMMEKIDNLNDKLKHVAVLNEEVSKVLMPFK